MLMVTVLAVTGIEILPRAVNAVQVFYLGNDPVMLIDYRLGLVPIETILAEIETALDNDDIELAESLLEIAASRDIDVPAATTERLAEKNKLGAIAVRSAADIWRGVTGEETNTAAGLTASVVSDLSPIGDVRDLYNEMNSWPEVDYLTVGLAGTGLALTAGTFSLLAAPVAAPAKAGLSTVKRAYKAGMMSTGFTDALTDITKKTVNLDAANELAGRVRKLNVDNLKALPDDLIAISGRVINPGGVELLSGVADDIYNIGTSGGRRGISYALSNAESLVDLTKIRKISQSLKRRFIGAVHLLGDATKSLWRLGNLLFSLLGWLVAGLIWTLGALMLLAKVGGFMFRKRAA